MGDGLAWTLAIGGLGLGGLGALVPGFPGAAVALLGVAAFAALTDFVVVTPTALTLACVLALAGGAAQLLAPVVGARMVTAASGAATGAAVGTTLGLLAPAPILALLVGAVGAAVGGWFGQARLRSRLAAAAGGCAGIVVASAVDFVAVLGIGAVLAVGSFLAG